MPAAPALRTAVQPMFKWTGSKQRMLAQYEPLFFPDKFERFVDLFAGGLTNTLWVAQQYPNKPLVINDFNGELVHLYHALRDHDRKVIRHWNECRKEWLALPNPEARKEQYYIWRDEYCFRHKKDSPRRIGPNREAGLLLFMLQVNFNGMWKAYIKQDLRYSTPPGTCLQNERFFADKRRHIEAVTRILQRDTTEITQGDFADVELRRGDFVYADPPYRDSVVEYQGGFSEEDQIRLADHLVRHRGPFAYSNKDIGDGFFRDYFPGCEIHDMSATYTAGRGTSVLSVKEVLVTRFSVPRAPRRS